jgi:hypothetical protein
MKTLRTLLAALCFALLASAPARATITVLNYWRMGENDPGAVSGGHCTNTVDAVGGDTLTNTTAGGLFLNYTNGVSTTASADTGSALALALANSEYLAGPLATNLTNNFGIECWVNPSTTVGGHVLAYNGLRGNGWGLYQGADFQVLYGGVVFWGSAPVTVGAWTHLALVRNNGVAILYTNGVPANTNSSSVPITPTGSFTVGGDAQFGEFFTGSIDEVRVFTFAAGAFSTNDLLLNSPHLFVSNTNDHGPGSLRQAVLTAATFPGPGTITFATNLSGQVILLTSGAIALSNNVTIDASALANGIQINPNYNSAVFTILNATVVLNSLTLTNGNASFGSGATILNNSGTVTVNNCLFAENAAYDGKGGAIANIAGTMTVNNSTFTSNYATITTGWNSLSNSTGGGAIFNGQAALTVNGCSFIGNYGDGGVGGGAFWCNGTLPVTVNNSTFVGNSATNAETGGGAICCQSGPNLSVNNCTFTGNTAANSSTGGGGIYTSGNLNLVNCIVCSNLAGTGAEIYCGNNLTMVYPLTGPEMFTTASIYEANNLLVKGGLFGVNPQLAPLDNNGGQTPTMLPLPGSPAIDAGTNSVTNFLATDQRGLPRLSGAHVDIGAMEVQPGDTNTLVTTTADSGSGSLRFAAFLVNLGVTNRITFSNTLSGQTILLTSGQIVLSSSVTIDASALANGIQINGNHQSRIIEINDNQTVMLNSLTITNGYLDNNPNGGCGILNFGTLTMTNCTVAGNQANNSSYGGGGILNSGTLTMTNCTVAGNVSYNSGKGGGVLAYGSLTMNNCIITGNQAYSDNGGDSYGGGIYMNGNMYIINNCTISGNYSDGGGGGVYADSSGVVTVNNSTINNNNAGGQGGGGICVFYGGVATVNNSTIIANRAAAILGGGGGICNYGGSLKVNNSTITGNQVTNSTDGGGGILNFYLSGSSEPTMNLTNCIVYSNSANTGGPELENKSGNMTVAYCLLGPEGINAIVDINTTSTTLTNSLVAVNPLLAPLGNYGGPTQTMPPEPGSPTLGAGNVAAASQFAADQRGFPRVVNGMADIGAVEIQSGQYYSVVENNLDSGPGSLRQVVSNAPANSTITFDASLSGQVITLTGGQIVLSNSPYLNGSGLTNGVQINGNNSSRIFQVTSGSSARLEYLTLTNGNPGTGNPGGAIFNQGVLTLAACALVGNTGAYGGAIENRNNCTLEDCTLANNYAADNGGAIDNNDGPLVLLQCTLAGNIAASGGGGVANYLNTLAFTNTIIANNTSGGSGADIYNFASSTINAGGTNLVLSYGNAGTFNGTGSLISKAPLLAPLGNYGGLTPTMPPMRGSPAIDGGSAAAYAGEGFYIDQRGYPRVSGARVDIGAVEVQIADAPFSLTELTHLTNGSFQFDLPNLVGGSFTVFASTNAAQPFNTWSNLGPVLETPVGTGQFQFTDSHATNYPRRFYLVTSP